MHAMVSVAMGFVNRNDVVISAQIPVTIVNFNDIVVISARVEFRCAGQWLLLLVPPTRPVVTGMGRERFFGFLPFLFQGALGGESRTRGPAHGPGRPPLGA